MKLKDITSYAKMKFGELRQEAKKVIGEARKALNKLLKSEDMRGHYSIAYEILKRTKPKKQASQFDLRNKNRNQMLREIKRAKEFLENPTSTVEGVYKYERNVKKQLADELGWNVDTQQMNKMWKLYNKLKSENKWIADKQFKYQAVEQIMGRLDAGMSPQEVVNTFDDIIDNIGGLDRGEEDNGEGWFDIFSET